jgi:trk system potassium uptake protein TrkA
MKIIILGAGQVGGSLAEHLASEANDITVVDTDGERLRDLGDRLDIRTVQGRGSLPSVLRQAGADDADMLVAVTNSDETNMVACQVAHTLFHTPTKIARVREASYLHREEQLFQNEAIPVDVLISPEQVVTNYIKRLIEHPGALQVIDFAEGAGATGGGARLLRRAAGRSATAAVARTHAECRNPRGRDFPPRPADPAAGRHGDRGR